MKRKILICGIGILGLAACTSQTLRQPEAADAGFAQGEDHAGASKAVDHPACRSIPQAPMPEWIAQPVAKDAQRYYGYGVAGIAPQSEATSFDQLRRQSRQAAQQELAESLQVHVRSSLMLSAQQHQQQDSVQYQEVLNQTIDSHTELFLQNVQVDALWLNHDTCQLWTRVSIDQADYRKGQQMISAQVDRQLSKLSEQIGSLQAVITTDPNVILRQHNLRLDDHGYYHALQLPLPQDEWFSVLDLYARYKYTLNKNAFYFPINSELMNFMQSHVSYLGGATNLSLLHAIALTSKQNSFAEGRLLQWAQSRELDLQASISVNNIWASSPNGCHYEGCLQSDLLKFRHRKPKSGDRYQAIHFAAIAGSPVMVDALIENGVERLATTDKGYTPLALALDANNTDVIDHLLKRPENYLGDEGVALEVAWLNGFRGFDRHVESEYWALQGTSFVADFAKQLEDARNRADSITTHQPMTTAVRERLFSTIAPMIDQCQTLASDKAHYLKLEAQGDFLNELYETYGLRDLEQADEQLARLQTQWEKAYVQLGNNQEAIQKALSENDQRQVDRLLQAQSRLSTAESEAQEVLQAMQVQKDAMAKQISAFEAWQPELPVEYRENVVTVCTQAQQGLNALMKQ